LSFTCDALRRVTCVASNTSSTTMSPRTLSASTASTIWASPGRAGARPVRGGCNATRRHDGAERQKIDREGGNPHERSGRDVRGERLIVPPRILTC
jgi:hypothetical protein